MNEKPEIKAKIQKADLKKDNSDENMSNILDKTINKITKITISSSLSDKKDKKKEEKNVKKEQGSAHNSNKDLVKIKTKSNMIKEKNSVKINNENPSSLRSSNAPKRKKVKNNHSENKKLTNSNDQIIKNFNSEDYNIIGMLGEGTFSQIFLVENGETKEKFALKKLTATKVEDLESKKEEFELILKLRKEEKQLNIVKIYGIQIKKLDKFNMVLYILMEAAKSDWETELKNRHFAKNFYNEEELKNILISLVKTFSSLQKRGICHRDVKPQNILYFEKDGYKITDFGEGKANKNGNLGKNCNFNLSEDTSVQTVRGTELYMSPILFNALRNSPGDDLQYNAFKSDVFSLGLCFLLAGSLSYKPLSELRDLYEMDKIKLLIEKRYTIDTLARIQLVNDMKEKECYVSYDFESEIRETNQAGIFESKYKMPDGESFNEVKKRMKNVIEEIVDKYKNTRIVALSHATAITCFLLNYVDFDENYPAALAELEAAGINEYVAELNRQMEEFLAGK